MSDTNTSMGALFNQRRAARQHEIQQKQQQQKEPQDQNVRPPSLLDIQAEQQKAKDINRVDPKEPSTSWNTGSSRASGRRGRQNDRSSLPKEQGAIATLKDSFGFLRCANREDEIFFHFSEVSGCHPADLQVDDEVEFKVGRSRNDDKMAAYGVVRLEPGTVIWEVEDEPGARFQGIVERPIRSDRGSGSSQMVEGTIRMLVAHENEGPEEKDIAATGPLVRFTSSDLQQPTESDDNGRGFRRMESVNSNSSRGGGRLFSNDLVEFRLVTSKRNSVKYAREIKLLQSEKERQRVAREKKLLEDAKPEQGIVTSLKNDFGFLRSNRRREEVYFHYSNVELPEDGENGEQHVLNEGQEMEFLVIPELVGSGRKEKLSARKVRFLEAGTVVFQTTVAEGVTGVVTRTPPISDAGSSGNLDGIVKLACPIKTRDLEGEEVTVTDVAFRSADSPGGSFAVNREGTSLGLWVREGDILLFDVVKDTVDGACRIFPTRYKIPPPQGGAANDGNGALDESRAVRLVETSLTNRAEGVVNAIKEGYGFIHFAERSVDVYFRTYEVFPEVLREDLYQNMGLKVEDPPKLTVGTEVQFDLSLQGIQTVPQSRSRQKGPTHDKENLKAQRLLFLPRGTILQTKNVAIKAKGVVCKEDPKQTYAGLIELDVEHSVMTLEERHPLVSKMIRTLLGSTSDPEGVEPPNSVVFHDPQSTKEEDVVLQVIESMGKGKIQSSHIPIAGELKHPGRLRLTRVDENPKTTIAQHSSSHSGDEGDVTQESEAQKTDDDDDEIQDRPRRKRKKKKNSKLKPVKIIRYDKHSLVKELQEGLPPSTGDIVVCDVVQSRRTGVVSLANLRIIERAVDEENEVQETGVGVVAEVVPARQFGFIALVDEDASKRENLFFNFKHVKESKGHADGRLRSMRTDSVKKGNEVRFDVSVAKNGKRAAINIEILPKGTLNIPSKAAKNACHGYVLMEPSHSSLADTPNRGHGARGGSLSPKRGGGRWDHIGKDEQSKSRNKALAQEEGCILLIKDPTNMFGPKTPPPALPDANADATTKQKVAASATATRRLQYKNTGVALHGTGASEGTDISHGLKRGDLVSFVKAKGGQGVRDIRVIAKNHATLVRGRLEKIELNTTEEKPKGGSAIFIAANEEEDEYPVSLQEVISCDISLLKDKVQVEGLLHDGKVYGICRTTDLYLESKLGKYHKERPKLNLTVRKDLGGKILAQSMMAKGPDGTNGFVPGWTKRRSQYEESR